MSVREGDSPEVAIARRIVERKFRILVRVMIAYAAFDSITWANQLSVWKVVVQLREAVAISEKLEKIGEGIDRLLYKLEGTEAPSDDRESSSERPSEHR